MLARLMISGMIGGREAILSRGLITPTLHAPVCGATLYARREQLYEERG